MIADMHDAEHAYPQESEELVTCQFCTDSVADLTAHHYTCHARARAMLDEMENKRLTECNARIQAILDEYGYEIHVTPARALIRPKGR